MRTLSLLAVVTSLCALPAQQQQSFTYPQLLESMTKVDWLWQPPAPGDRCIQFSSYDRRSEKGPGDSDAWYANDDRGHFLRVEEKEGKKEFVMVAVGGPGVLTRIWSANPSGELYFDVDGERVWTVDFEALCSGRVKGVPEPLAGVRARGANCYLPIPFQRYLKVSTSKGDCYYQCNVVQFGSPVTLPSFTAGTIAKNRNAIEECAGELGEATGRRVSGLGRNEPIRGPSVIRELEVRMTGADMKEDLADLLRQVLLVVRCGEEETIRVPVADFFAGGSAWRPWRGRFLGIKENGTGYCRFPIPMPEGGEVRLEFAPRLRDRAPLLFAHVEPTLFDGNPLLFRASYHQEKQFDSRPFHDFKVLAAKGGPGRFVGTSLLVKNPTRAWWGEGDEKFYVDGETFPSTFGTGTEDYFGYAWCCPEPFSSPLHAQTQCDGPGNYGFTALHRSQILDSVPFHESFIFDLEVWHWVEGLKMDYASVAYWYGAPGVSSGLPPVPPAAERTLDRLPPPPVFVAKDAIEGEALRVVSMSGGHHEVQDMSFKENTFSRDGQRWWREGKLGDTLVLAVPVPAAGRYRVTGAFCKANDYGIVRMTFADQQLGEFHDFFSPHVDTSGVLRLGEVDLEVGEAMLRVEITGHNEKAVPKHMFGLDYLRLERVR